MARQNTSRLAPEWRAWLAENLVLGCRPAELTALLIEAGVPPALARAELDAAAAHPALSTGAHVAGRRAGVDSLLEVYSALHRQSAASRTLERRPGLSPREFFERYYFEHRPVVLQGLLEEGTALQAWRPERLAERFGHVRVEIMSGRESDPDHDYAPDSRRRWMLLRDFVRDLLTRGATNDYYLTGHNLALERRELRPMLDELRLPEGFLGSRPRRGSIKLWMGPAGTFTALHHDSSCVLFGQIHGRKHFLLIPSFQIPLVYNHRSCWSAVTAERPDFARYPAFRDVCVQEVVLAPGDLLFIPVGWWHQVRALDVSVSVTFQELAVPGGNTRWERGEQA